MYIKSAKDCLREIISVVSVIWDSNWIIVSLKFSGIVSMKILFKQILDKDFTSSKDSAVKIRAITELIFETPLED